MTKQSELMAICERINTLEDRVQINLLSYISNKVDNLELKIDEEKNFLDLVKIVVDSIVEGLDETTIKSKLEECKLNKIFISPLYKYCTNIAQPRIHAEVVKSVNKDQLISICNFTLNNVILYSNQRSLKAFAESLNLEKDVVKGAIVFVYNFYRKVCSRENSPDYLKERLKDQFEFSEDHIAAFMKPLLENLAEAQQAYMLSRIEELLDRTNSTESDEEE